MLTSSHDIVLGFPQSKSWTIKKADHWIIDAFELWYWRRPLRVPWTARRSILKETQLLSTEETLNIHWKDWCQSWSSDTFAHLMWKADSLEKTWCWERWRQEEKGTAEDEMVRWHHRHYGHEFEQASGVGDGQESLGGCSPWGHKELDTTEQLNWLIIFIRREEGGNKREWRPIKNGVNWMKLMSLVPGKMSLTKNAPVSETQRKETNQNSKRTVR